MNIGFDASRAFIGKKTGTENYSYQILSHLQKLDHHNKYFIYVRAGFSRPLELGSENPTPTIIPYPRLWTQAGLALQTFKDPLDVLFIPAHTLPIIRKPGLKTVITVHDLGAEYLPSTHQLKQRLYLNFMTYHQLKSADHIIAVSEATKEDIVKKVGINPKKITVIYEDYNQKLVKPVKGNKLLNTLSKYKLENQDYFLFVGTIQPRKNLERLIRAFSVIASEAKQSQNQIAASPSAPRNDNVNLVLAGGKGWLADEIYQLPKKLGIADQVKFLGYVPDEDLPALYSGAKAFLFPSLFEGFGLPILEAWACNCPVLTSNISSMLEVVDLNNVILGRSASDDSRITFRRKILDSQTRQNDKKEQMAAILVDPYSVENIAQGITKITNNQITRNKLIKAGQKQLANFSWEKAAKETLKLLQVYSK